jgi:hypothetical protein
MDISVINLNKKGGFKVRKIACKPLERPTVKKYVFIRCVKIQSYTQHA